jgi:UDP:flavonoid glycosyltransferase YjiC (YdhE family)
VRILFTTMPGTGHLYPMLPLVRAAQRAGHEVVIATASDLAAEVRTLGLPVWEVGPTFAESFAELARSRPVLSRLSEHDQTVAGALGLFGAAAARRAPGLLELASDWHPGLVIREMTELSGAVVAEQLRVPHVIHGLGPHQPGLAEAMRAVAADLATRFDLPDFRPSLGQRPTSTSARLPFNRWRRRRRGVTSKPCARPPAKRAVASGWRRGCRPCPMDRGCSSASARCSTTAEIC